MRKSGSVYYLHVWLHSGVGEIWLISPSEWLWIDRPEQLTDTHRREAAISGQDFILFPKASSYQSDPEHLDEFHYFNCKKEYA